MRLQTGIYDTQDQSPHSQPGVLKRYQMLKKEIKNCLQYQFSTIERAVYILSV